MIVWTIGPCMHEMWTRATPQTCVGAPDAETLAAVLTLKEPVAARLRT